MPKGINFSIIVPTHDRPQLLQLCLSAIARLNYPAEQFEVIIVDDGSKQASDPIISRFNTRLNLHLLKQSNAGPASARNLGAEHATGDYFAFTDDDCMPTRDWLWRLAESLRNKPDVAVCGKTLNFDDQNAFSIADQLISDYLVSHYNRDPENALFALGNNLAISREHYHGLEGFNADFVTGEDREFCYRLRKMNLRLIHEPRAVVFHAHPLTLKTFFQRHYSYGKGSCRYHRRCGGEDHFFYKLEPLSFYANLIKYPFMTLQKPHATLITGMLIVSQSAICLGFANELYRERIPKASD